MVCKKCGQQIDDQAVVCVYCGAKTKLYKKAFKKPFYKKWWFWALLIVILLASCTAGGGDSETTTNTTHPTSTVSPSESISTELPGPTEATPVEVVLPETVIFDKNDIKITIVGFGDSSVFSKEIKILVENNTNQNIAFSGDTFNVNGISMHGSLYIDVAAGKKANGTLDFSTTNLRTAHIDEIATISCFDSTIYDTDTFELVHSAPFTINSSISDTYIQTINDEGEVLYDQNGFTVIAKPATDNILGKTMMLLVKNNTEYDISVAVDNISVNGFTITTWLYDTIYAGTVRYCDFDLMSSDLEENEIEEIENVTFTLNFINRNSFETIASTEELEVLVED